MSSPFEDLTRRRLLAGASLAALATGGLDAQTNAQVAFVMPPPKAITGGVKPLIIGHTARPLRYRPVDGDFVIRNGGEFFNRPIYGQNINFRVDAGDLPEFSLYLPGHAGNLKLGISAAAGSKWLSQAAEVVARYRPGRMIYDIHDPFLGAGSLRIEALATGTGPGFMLRVEPREVSASVSLTDRDGDLCRQHHHRPGDWLHPMQLYSGCDQLGPLGLDTPQRRSPLRRHVRLRDGGGYADMRGRDRRDEQREVLRTVLNSEATRKRPASEQKSPSAKKPRLLI